jgi:phage host-nuclease inhibitor protein Gam
MKTSKSKRVKVPLAMPALLATREDAEATMNDLAATANNQRKIQAQLDDEILRIKAFYEPNLTACTQAIGEYTAALQAWAESNPAEFKGLKSITFNTGRLGFRTGTPKLILLNRRWTWKTALRAVQAFLPNFIRNDPAIDAEALIAQRDESIIAETLPKCGLQVTQGESFFVEPDLTDTDARQVTKTEAAPVLRSFSVGG